MAKFKINKENFTFFLNTVGVLFGIAAACSTIAMGIRIHKEVSTVKTEFAKQKAEMVALTKATNASLSLHSKR